MLPYIQSLTGIRFLVVSMIVIMHMIGVLWIPKGFGIGFYPNLGNAVTFFFCLSGFVLHYNYHEKIYRTPYWKFFLLRFFRIWPLHAIVFLWSFFLFYPDGTRWILNNLSLLELTQIFTLTQSLNPDKRVYFGVNGVSWFISTLVFFYAFFPFISRGMGRRPWATMFTIITIISVYLAIASTIFYNPEIPGNAHGLGAINPLARLIDFTFGVAVCELMIRKGLINYKQKRHIETQQIIWTLIEIFCLVTLLIAGYFLFHFIINSKPYLNPVIEHWLRGSCNSFFYSAFIALIAFERGWLSRLFRTKVFVWFGSLSFAIFLVHQRLIIYWQRYIEPSPMPFLHQVVSYLITLTAISACCYYFIELPVMNKMRKFINNI